MFIEDPSFSTTNLNDEALPFVCKKQFETLIIGISWAAINSLKSRESNIIITLQT